MLSQIIFRTVRQSVKYFRPGVRSTSSSLRRFHRVGLAPFGAKVSRVASVRSSNNSLPTLVPSCASFATHTLETRALLTDDHHQLVATQRGILLNLLQVLSESKGDATDIEALKSSLEQLEQLFLICIVGEFNVGKSTFINALLGDTYLKEGPTPTTEDIWRINYSEDGPRETVDSDGIRTLHCPVSFLKDCQFVDTPGTNVIIDGHRQITDKYIPHADLVLFVTSADRPFTESETSFIRQIQAWSKKIVFVVNKADIFRKPADLDQVLDFVKSSARDLLGIDNPIVFPTSAAETLEAKMMRSSISDSNQFLALEQYLFQTLSQDDRIKLKLRNPVGVADAVAARGLVAVSRARKVMERDVAVLESVNRNIDSFQADMERDFDNQIHQLDTILLEMLERADEFLTDNLTITNIPTLAFGGNALRDQFEKKVLKFTSQDIDDHIHGLMEWLISKNDRESKAIFEYVAHHTGSSDRNSEHIAPPIVGEVSMVFDENRRTILKRMIDQSRQTVRGYNIDQESQNLVTAVQQAIAATTVVEAGALGVGALVSASLLDWTGMLGAGLLAVTGIYVLPYQRHRIKTALRASVSDLRGNLRLGLNKHLKMEQAKHVERIHDGLRPFTRFVEQQTSSLQAQHDSLLKAKSDLAAVSASIEQLDGH